MKLFVISITLVSMLTICSAYAKEAVDVSSQDHKVSSAKQIKEKDRKPRGGAEKYQKWLNKLKEGVKTLDRQIAFKGKVVDFSGKPIQDARVVIGLTSFDPAAEFFSSSKNHEILTDENGLFVLKGKGSSVSVRDVMKDGYEFKLEYADYTRFEFDNKFKQGKAGLIPFDPATDKPAVFKIRKRGVVDFLFTKSFNWPFKKSKNEPFQPLLLGEWKDPYGKEMNLLARESEKNKALELSCEFNEDYSRFKLIFRGVFEDSGVYLSNKLLYEAPIEGYQKQVVYQSSMLKDIDSENKQGFYYKPLFLYVKGPSGSYYSRVDLLISTSPFNEFHKDASARVSGKIYTNPEGRRYL